VKVDAAVNARLSLGVVLPAGFVPGIVTLDGRPVAARRVSTTRGDELVVQPRSSGKHTLTVLAAH
jgi:hypothetical protein